MADDNHETVLRRKLARPVARRGGAGRGPVSVPRALTHALARAAQRELGLELTVTGHLETAPDLDAIERAVGDNALLALLEGPAGATGILILSGALLSGLVAQRMTGRLPVSAPAPRAPTRIDAEMVRDLIDGTLAGLSAPFADDPGYCWVRGYCYRSFLADRRLTRFSLADTVHHGFHLDLELSGGALEGTMFLALPDCAEPERGAPDGQAVATDWSTSLRANVLDAELPIDAVLARLHLPLSRVAKLAPGDLLALPRQAIDAVRLEAGGRALVASGRLGQSRGERAVRLEGDAQPLPETAAVEPDPAPAPPDAATPLVQAAQ